MPSHPHHGAMTWPCSPAVVVERMRWPALPKECRAVLGLVGVQSGGLQKGGGNSLLLWSGISVQNGPGRKDIREPGRQLGIDHLLFLAFFFSLLSFTLAVR